MGPFESGHFSESRVAWVRALTQQGRSFRWLSYRRELLEKAKGQTGRRDLGHLVGVSRRIPWIHRPGVETPCRQGPALPGSGGSPPDRQADGLASARKMPIAAVRAALRWHECFPVR